MDDDGYFNALVRMFEQALKAISQLETSQKAPLLERLDRVQRESIHWGWDVCKDLDVLMEEYGFDEE